ncbi:MAG TPA: hypothetical protein V6C95_05455 [Coleofasciculaceae cyanobacterium]
MWAVHSAVEVEYKELLQGSVRDSSPSTLLVTCDIRHVFLRSRTIIAIAPMPESVEHNH